MFKNAKKRIMLAVLTMLALSNAISAAAATSGINRAEYTGGYVSKGSDFETDQLQKATRKDDGTNKVSAIDNGAWCSWILNWNGLQVTKQVNYSGTGTYYMSFTHEADVDSDKTAQLQTRMVISTRWYEFGSTYTSGEWSPDTF